MLKSTTTCVKTVRFEGLRTDVDERAKLGQQKRKERKLRRQRKKMAKEQNLETVRGFLRSVVALQNESNAAGGDGAAGGDVAAGGAVGDNGAAGGEQGIFRALTPAQKLARINQLTGAQLALGEANAQGYFVEENFAQHLLRTEDNSHEDNWSRNDVFVYSMLTWAYAAKREHLYTTLSLSSNSGESGDSRGSLVGSAIPLVEDTGVVQQDRRLDPLIHSLEDYRNTFLGGRGDGSARIRGLFALDDIDALTRELRVRILGRNFQTAIPQNDDEGELENAITEAITRIDPSGSHHVHLRRCVNWLVAAVPEEERRAVFNGVFGPRMDTFSWPPLLRIT